MTIEQRIKEDERPSDSIEDSGKAFAAATIELTHARTKGNTRNAQIALGKILLEVYRAKKLVHSSKDLHEILSEAIEESQTIKATF